MTALRSDLSEKQWQQVVVDYARLKGWRVYHTFDARRSTSGFPDLTLVRGGRLVFAELKAEGGRTTDEQRAWIAALAATGAECFIWTPSALPLVLERLA